MSFSGYYPLGLRSKGSSHQEAAVVVPDSIGAQGEEGATGYAEEDRWGLYQTCERIREAAKKTPSGEEEENAGVMNDPQKAIDGLMEVRAELDIVMDIVQVAEEQQFLSLTHIPHTVDAKAAARQELVRQGLKREQLKSIAERLRMASEELKDKYMNMRFLDEVRELRKRWLLKEYRSAGGEVLGEDCVCVDISFSVEDGSVVRKKNSLGKYKFVIAGGQDGQACALLEEDKENVVVVGWRQIDEALRRLQNKRAWKYIYARLESESERLSQSLGVHPDVHAAVMRLAARSTHDSTMDVDISHLAVSGYKDVMEFSTSDVCASLFEQKARSMLGEAIAWHRVPLIVRRATPTKPKSFLEQLCFWITHVSLWSDVSSCVTAPGNMSEFIGRLSSETRVPRASVMVYNGSQPTSLVGSISIEQDGSMVWESAMDDAMGMHSGMNMGRLQVLHIIKEVMKGGSCEIDVQYTD